MPLLDNIVPGKAAEVPKDDNSAIASAAENPYLSITIAQVQAAYDTMYDAVEYLLEGKKESLKSIDKWLDKWESKLKTIQEKYKELLDKFNDLSSSAEAALALDVAREAWEILQDFPILRRYMGEANYWLLYDTIGVVASQGSSLAGDLSTAIKSALKAGIKGLLAMTDGLMSLESYLGVIAQQWGAIYTKMIAMPLLDSIVPNVTSAYFFKPVAPATDGMPNPPPGPGLFIPAPIPIPDPAYAASHRNLNMSVGDPETWRDSVTQEPKFINIDAMEDALMYWGSSYTDETIPGITSSTPDIPALYQRRQYMRDGVAEDHPLKVGCTFAQLDTSRTEAAYQGNSSSANGEALKKFKELDRNTEFHEALVRWQNAWNESRASITALLHRKLDGRVYALDNPANTSAFTSMKQLDEAGHNLLVSALFENTASPVPELSAEAYSALLPLENATYHMIHVYLKATGQPPRMDGISLDRYRMSKSKELSSLLAQAAMTLRLEASGSSPYSSTIEALPVLTGITFADDHLSPYSKPFMKILPVARIPESGEAADGFTRYTVDTGDSYWWEIDGESVWVSPPAYSMEDEGMEYPWRAYAASLLYPSKGAWMPLEFYKRGDEVMQASSDNPISLGTVDDGALTNPAAWNTGMAGDPNAYAYPINGFFLSADIDAEAPTVIGALLNLSEDVSSRNTSLDEEIADAVGYSILKGRRPLAACFGVYGKLLGMFGWCFKAMPSVGLRSFTETYARIPGSDLWYMKSCPDKIVYRHSTFYSATMSQAHTIYHDAMAYESYQRGEESYAFYVFPTESVSVQEIKPGTAGTWRSIDAIGPDGRQWHYITMHNAVPKCPKYIEADKWSIADILHELYLLAWGMSPFCGDNGARYARLKNALDDFGVSAPTFIGQLPNDGEDKAAPFRIGIFDDYAERVEELVNSIYSLRAEILAATEAW